MESNYRGKNVVVTGGAGFIGSHVVRRLVELGVGRVTVIDSLRYGDQANLAGLGDTVKLIPFTLGTDDPMRLTEMLKGAQLLFHLAAEKHNQSKDEPTRVLRANVEGTQHLYEAAVAGGVERIVYASSLYAYGRVSGAPYVETEVPNPQTIYGTTKLAGEHLLRTVGNLTGLSWNVVRYLFVYGPRQFAGMGYKSVILRNFERALRGERMTVYGDGEQALDYVYVDDAVDATLRVMSWDGSGEVFNVGSGRAVKVGELLAMMCEVAGVGRSVETLPADWTAGSYRVGDVAKVRGVLGWTSQVGLEDGLRRTYRWMQGDGSI